LAHFFFNLKRAKQPLHSQQQAVTPDPAISNSKKVRQTAITICSGLSHLTGWAALPSEYQRGHITAVLRVEKLSDDIIHCLFLKNMKGLNLHDRV
jgi:hypothetical protein